MANNVGSALSTLLTSGQTFYAPFADKGSGEVSLIASGAGASQAATFTRATTATTVNSAGLIVSVASGTPRSYYDPTTLQYLGYLAEGARTNLCLQSADLATSWTPVRASVGVNQVASPDGSVNADKLIEDSTAANSHYIQAASISIANTTAYTFSAFVKPAGRSFIAVQGDISGGFLGGASGFSLSGAGSVVGLGAGVSSATIVSYPNGWYRITVTATSSGITASPGVALRTSSGTAIESYNGDGTSGVYLWGAQLEAGAFASSYIPTTTASVTRNADVLTYPFSGNADATVGTAYAEVSTLWTTLGTAQSIIDFADRSALVVDNAASTTIRISDGTNAALKTGLTSMVTGIRKRASSWGGAGLLVTGDGASPATATFDGNMGSTAIGIGINGSGSARPWFGTICNVRIYQTQLSSAQLQAVTA